MREHGEEVVLEHLHIDNQLFLSLCYAPQFIVGEDLNGECLRLLEGRQWIELRLLGLRSLLAFVTRRLRWGRVVPGQTVYVIERHVYPRLPTMAARRFFPMNRTGFG